MLYNFAVASAVALYEAVLLARSGHPALAGVDLWLVVEVNIALPLAIRVLVRALAGDLVRADRDPLTGLLNRRAFQHNALGMILDRRGTDAHLLVSSVDLVNFKALNDNRGHAAGDRALVQATQAMLAAVDDQAVVARSGGEESSWPALRRPATLRRWLPALIASSDAAMYRAKRLGGNQFHHHELCG